MTTRTGDCQSHRAAILQLIKLLKDIDEDVRNNAVLALGQIRIDQAITPLIKLFRSWAQYCCATLQSRLIKSQHITE
ncbi:MAG: HEAT repeat domain-containing protein [Thioploca sp.]|nr:HEAT repeat domain-containing protein [Thioploca sp.]